MLEEILGAKKRIVPRSMLYREMHRFMKLTDVYTDKKYQAEYFVNLFCFNYIKQEICQ